MKSRALGLQAFLQSKTVVSGRTKPDILYALDVAQFSIFCICTVTNFSLIYLNGVTSLLHQSFTALNKDEKHDIYCLSNTLEIHLPVSLTLQFITFPPPKHPGT